MLYSSAFQPFAIQYFNKRLLTTQFCHLLSIILFRDSTVQYLRDPIIRPCERIYAYDSKISKTQYHWILVLIIGWHDCTEFSVIKMPICYVSE